MEKRNYLKPGFRFLVILVASLLVPLTSFAVDINGSIQGKVTDSNGNPVANVDITLLNLDTGYYQTISSKDDGRYRARLLPLGTYQVTAVKTGLAVYQQDGIKLTIGSVVSLDMVLKPITFEETITVTADAPIVEVSNTDGGSTVGQISIESLPLNGRNFEDHVLLTAGAVADNYHVQVGGQRGINNNLMMDGADNNSAFFSEQRGGTRPPFTFSQEAVKEFEVLNNAFSAEFGRAGGGIINAVTKSGTNTYSGSLFYYFKNDALVEDKQQRGSYVPSPQEDFDQNQYGATLGGPILKDKLFFFIAYDGQRKDIPIDPYVDPYYSQAGDDAGNSWYTDDPENANKYNFYDRWNHGYLQTQDGNTLLTKIDWIINSNHHATFRHNYSRYDSENGTTTSGIIDYNGHEKTQSDSFVGSLTSIFTENLYNEVRFQYANEKRPREPNSTTPATSISGEYSIDFGQRTYLPSNVDENRYQFADTLTWILGDHEIKFGGDYNTVDIANTFLRYGGGSYEFASTADFPNNPESYTQAWDRSGKNGKVDFTTKDYSLFIQDAWQPSEALTVNLGIRYDLQDQPNIDMPNPNANILPWYSDDEADRYNPTLSIPTDNDNWGPRVAVAWSPFESKKTVFRAGWGMFFSRTPSLLVATAMANNGYRIVTMQMNPSHPNFPSYPNTIPNIPEGNLLTPDIYIFSPDFENPQTNRWSVGIEHELITDLSIGLEYINATTTHLERKMDVNLKQPEWDESKGRYMFSRVRINSDFGKIIQFTDDAYSEYDAMIFKINKRFSNNYQFMASYTWSKSYDNDSNETSTELYGYDYPENVYDLSAEWGPSNFDIRHRFIVSGVYQFAELLNLPDWYELELSGIFEFSSGKPWSPEFSGDGNRDGFSRNDRPHYRDPDTGEWIHPGRNSERHPNYKNVDLRLTNGFKFKKMKLELIFEAFNVFDWPNWTVNYAYMTFNEEYPPGTNYGKTEYAGNPRQYQLGARFKF